MGGGSTPSDGAAAAKLFGQAGIDLLDISGGICGYIRPGLSEQGYFGELTAAVKATVGLSVILTEASRTFMLPKPCLSRAKPI